MLFRSALETGTYDDARTKGVRWVMSGEDGVKLERAKVYQLLMSVERSEAPSREKQAKDGKPASPLASFLQRKQLSRADLLGLPAHEPPAKKTVPAAIATPEWVKPSAEPEPAKPPESKKLVQPSERFRPEKRIVTKYLDLRHSQFTHAMAIANLGTTNVENTWLRDHWESLQSQKKASSSV